jgi:hypothetical protein
MKKILPMFTAAVAEGGAIVPPGFPMPVVSVRPPGTSPADVAPLLLQPANRAVATMALTSTIPE